MPVEQLRRSTEAPPTEAPRFVFPIAGSYSWGSAYGPRGGGFHNGTDLPAATGTPLVAVTAGKVTFQSGGAGGLAANLDAEDGTRYYYAHMSRQESHLEGKTVTAGTKLGEVGSTGHSTGAHLHFTIFKNGSAINSAPFLRQVEGKQVTPTITEGGAVETGNALTAIGISNPLDGLSSFLEMLTDPNTWRRLLYIIGGAGLIIFGTLQITGQQLGNVLGIG